MDDINKIVSLLSKMAMHVGETHVAATETIDEFFMIQSKKLEDCRVEIEYFRDIFHRIHANFIGRAIDEAVFQTSSRHPDREGVSWWSRPSGLGACGVRPKLSRPNHQSFAEQTPGFQIFE